MPTMLATTATMIVVMSTGEGVEGMMSHGLTPPARVAQLPHEATPTGPRQPALASQKEEQDADSMGEDKYMQSIGRSNGITVKGLP